MPNLGPGSYDVKNNLISAFITKKSAININNNNHSKHKGLLCNKFNKT